VTATTLRLEDLVEFIRNGLSISNRNGVGGIPITRIETISEHAVDPKRVGYAGVQLGERDDWLLERGDILFSHINSVSHLGKVALYEGRPEHLLHGMNLLGVRPKASIVLPQYLVRALRSGGFRAQLAKHIKPAVNQASVSISALKTLTLRIPDFAEQRRIVDLLDKADAIRRKRKAAMALTEELLRSAFIEMFGDPVTNPKGWPVRPLGALTVAGDSINYGVVQPGSEVPNGVPLVRVGDFEDMAINVHGLKRIDPAVEANYSRSRLRGDEVLIACVGSIGKVALADERLAGANIARAVARVRPGPQLARSYLAYFLATPFAQRHFLIETRTVSQPTLNIAQIQQTPILVPARSAQDEFTMFEDKARSTGRLQREAFESSAELFSSLVARAFSGGLSS
jgi:type I restriction enzyme S subunit